MAVSRRLRGGFPRFPRSLSFFRRIPLTTVLGQYCVPQARSAFAYEPVQNHEQYNGAQAPA